VPGGSAPRSGGRRPSAPGRSRRGDRAPWTGGRDKAGPAGAPYLLLAVVNAHPALLDHQGLVDLQEAAGPQEAVHGRRQAGLRRSPAPALPDRELRAGQPAAPPGGGRAGRTPAGGRGGRAG
jgi:hypothetical protein